jgi:probable addiction module antidote protein
MVKVAPFDTARHLDNPQVIAHYLAEAFESGDNRLIRRALRNVIRARQIAQIARATGMSRTSLYWKEKASPEFTTVLRVLDAIGVRLEPIPRGRARGKQYVPTPRRRRKIAARAH